MDREKFGLWMILDITIRVFAVLALIPIIANHYKNPIQPILILLFIIWAFRPIWSKWKNFSLNFKKINFKKPNKTKLGNIIISISIFFGLLLFLNRFDLVLNPSSFDFCLLENVKYFQSGILQLVRSFFEHFTFNFIFPLLVVLFGLGCDTLTNKKINFMIPFIIGAGASIILTLIWELRNPQIEIIEILYDFFAIFVSYKFVNWQLNQGIKSTQELKTQKSKK